MSFKSQTALEFHANLNDSCTALLSGNEFVDGALGRSSIQVRTSLDSQGKFSLLMARWEFLKFLLSGRTFAGGSHGFG